MARPSPPNFVSGQSGWDTVLQEWKEAVFDQPLALVQYADVSALTTAHSPAQFEACIAMVGNVLYVSDGTSWSAV